MFCRFALVVSATMSKPALHIRHEKPGVLIVNRFSLSTHSVALAIRHGFLLYLFPMLDYIEANPKRSRI